MVSLGESDRSQCSTSRGVPVAGSLSPVFIGSAPGMVAGLEEKAGGAKAGS